MKLLIRVIILPVLCLKFVFAQDCTSVISIKTDNPSANIFINNRYAGEGSVTQDVERGNYIIKVVQDSLTWNPVAFQDSFYIEDCGETKYLSYNFNEIIYVRTDPADSYVYSGDSLLGHTPLYLTTSIDRLRLNKPGYKEVIVSPEEINKSSLIYLDYLGEDKEVPFIDRDIFKILVGSAALLGGITAYFKLKADDYFEEYEFSGSKEMLDKTQKYDVISGITFGALQINFGILIYYFLIED